MVSSPREARVYDAFNPEARGIVWDYMNRYMFQLGMSAWWMDATEPEFYGAKQSDFNFQTKEGALRNVRNIYPCTLVRLFGIISVLPPWINVYIY